MLPPDCLQGTITYAQALVESSLVSFLSFLHIDYALQYCSRMRGEIPQQEKKMVLVGHVTRALNAALVLV